MLKREKKCPKFFNWGKVQFNWLSSLNKFPNFSSKCSKLSLQKKIIISFFTLISYKTDFFITWNTSGRWILMLSNIDVVQRCIDVMFGRNTFKVLITLKLNLKLSIWLFRDIIIVSKHRFKTIFILVVYYSL